MSTKAPQRLLKRVEDPETLALLQAAWEQGQRQNWSRATLEFYLQVVLARPLPYLEDPVSGPLARYLVERDHSYFLPRELGVWPNLSEANGQLEPARRLPISVYGAMLPGFQPGFGLPVGGVLAADNAVIPRAVGRDIGCRVHLTTFPAARFSFKNGAWVRRLREATRQVVRFGLEGECPEHPTHDIFEDPAWDQIPGLTRLRGQARKQLGTSGTGNHFVDFGVLRQDRGSSCLALLSHSGSRSLGRRISGHYHKLARELHPKLPRELQHWAS